MEYWPQEIPITFDGDVCPLILFSRLQEAARALGFEYCAFGMQMPFPLSKPRLEMFNNYPAPWRSHYAHMHYAITDPSIAHGRRSTTPTLWSDELFLSAPALWSEARGAGLRHGRIQSCLETSGTGSMLTLARSSEPITPAELQHHGHRLVWLGQVAHQAFARLLSPHNKLLPDSRLTSREIEVLRWTADGKTTSQISDILLISDHTVNFHIKNAVFKLQTKNKTAAAVRAALMGILS